MLVYWELPPSPNCLKVRMALRYKGIDFKLRLVDHADRQPVLDVSGQEGTPVIEDKGIVLNDSEAILQYLDANYRETPRLQPASKTERRACDAWKDMLDKRLARHWMPVFFHALGMKPTLDEAARTGFSEGLAWLESELADKDGFGPAINDLRVVEWVCYALPGPELLARMPLVARTREVFAADADSLPRLSALVQRWDSHLG